METQPTAGAEPARPAPNPSHRYQLHRVSLTPDGGGGARVDLRALKRLETRFAADGALASVVVLALNLDQLGELPVGSRWRLEAAHRDAYAGDRLPEKVFDYGRLEVRYNGLPSGAYQAVSEGHLVLVPC